MITVELKGRLGNQMFQYSLCRIISENKGYSFYLPSHIKPNGQNISDYFDLYMGENTGSPLFYKYSEDTMVQKYDPLIFEIKDGTLLSGFFQTEKYFLPYKNKIKEWFKIEMDYQTNLILEKFPIEEYCYIHFRGTDYKEWDSGKRILPPKYFLEAIDRIKQIKEDLKILVITDDEEFAKEYFPENEIMSNDMMTDFKLIYSSKYCIIPNSSFSWWASWLSDKEITIAPYCWLNYNNQELGFYPSDIRTNNFIYV